MLIFIDLLKQIIADVQTSGGAVVERSKPSPELLQKLKQHALYQITQEKADNWVLLEWFTEGFLDEYLRICSVHLRKIGIDDDDLAYRVLAKVVDQTISYRSNNHRRERARNFEDQLASSLILIWDQMGDEQTIAYTMAQERWLINWDYQNSSWTATGLGKLFLELSPLQAVIFLLSIDVFFSTGIRDFRHLHRDILRSLLHPSPQRDYDPPLLPFHRDLLHRLGIIQEVNQFDSDDYKLTPVGKIALRRLLNEDNPLRDAVSSLIENEELGFTFKGSSNEMNETLSVVGQTHLLNKADRESVGISIQLYQASKYLESLRVLYPSIEAVVNQMLINAGQLPEQFRGIVSKTQWLEKGGYIPSDISNAIEIFTGRNRVLHGNFSPPEDYVFPLSLLAFRYLRRLILEYQPNGNASIEPEITIFSQATDG